MLKEGRTDEDTLKVLWELYAGEFAEGYEEDSTFVHKGIGEVWAQVMEVVEKVYAVPGIGKGFEREEVGDWAEFWVNDA